MRGEPSDLLAADDRAARFLGALTMEELVRRDDKDDLVARLAEKVPTLENGLARIVADERTPAGRLHITFALRPGAVWQDGVPITSDDLVFAWRRGLAAPRGTTARTDADLVERVDLVDARTATYVLRPGVRTNRYPLLAHVLPRHLLGSGSTDAEATYARRPTHAGPFAIASWQEGIGVTLTPFERYALGAPSLARLEVRFYPDAAALVGGLQRGEVEMAPADSLTADLAPELERFAEGRGLAVRYTPQSWAEFLLFDLRGDLADERVRAAVTLAIDRRGLNQQLFGGRARIPSSYLFAPSWASAEIGQPPERDLDAARELLSAAGFCAAPSCVLAPPLRARILLESGSAPRLAAAELVVRDLSSLGVVASFQVYSPAAFATALALGDFDLAIAARGGADPAEATDEYVSTSTRNVTRYADAAFDVLASAAASFLTRQERRPIYAELQRIWAQDRPALPLFQELAVDVVPTGLEGVAPSPFHEPLSWNAHAWRHTAP